MITNFYQTLNYHNRVSGELCYDDTLVTMTLEKI